MARLTHWGALHILARRNGGWKLQRAPPEGYIRSTMEQQITLQGAPAPASEDGVHITLTPQAAAKAKALMARDARSGLALRVGVEGGGCSGMQYTLTFDQPRDGDIALRQDGVDVVVDGRSAGYLDGLTLDYVDALHGAGFKFLNPNANRTCGCGSSFSA